MGYRIVYGQDPVIKRKGGSLRGMTAAWMLLFAALVRLSWPAGREVLAEVLLPRAETAAAFSEMVAAVTGGESFAEAVTVFCRSVVSNGMAQ